MSTSKTIEMLVVYKRILLICFKCIFKESNMTLFIYHIQLIAHFLHKILIMGYNHQTTIESLQRRDQSFDSVHIQMIGRLIQQQDVRLNVRERCKHDSRFLTSR